MTDFAEADRLLREAVAAHAFPAAAVEAGRGDGVLWRAAFGAMTFDPTATPATHDTIFDLASLTKVIVTATLTMRAVDEGRVSLDDPVGRWLRGWRRAGRKAVTVRDLLAHSGGLPAYLPFYRECTGRADFEGAIGELPLEYRPRERSVYSDLGFILLGFILEDASAGRDGFTGARGAFDPEGSLAAQFRPLAAYLSSEPLLFNPPRAWRSRSAPTEEDRWRSRLLQGEVHDENCWALGGVAGHAGLFGTAGAVGTFARAVLRTLGGERILAEPSTLRTFITRTDVPGSSRALAWDTMLPTSSCGRLLSPTAIGHTGFTGTSLWIDAERDLYIVLLTNRVHPTRDNDAIQAVRPRLHDAVASAVLSHRAAL
jgi:CubicO group peptidase (beta-lactamase class C family)